MFNDLFTVMLGILESVLEFYGLTMLSVI